MKLEELMKEGWEIKLYGCLKRTVDFKTKKIRDWYFRYSWKIKKNHQFGCKFYEADWEGFETPEEAIKNLEEFAEKGNIK
jgi:hypothetical protein